jgi:drug/metabolite transporter (DMT)-like permease
VSTRVQPGAILWLLFLALATIWGSSFLFIKIGLEEGLRPLTLVSVRLWTAATCLTVVALLVGARFPRGRGLLLRLGVLGIINVAIPFALITWGELFIPSALASILNGLVPLFTIFIAAVVLQDEPITVNRLVGLLIGFAGAVLLLSKNFDPGALAGKAGGEAFLGEMAIVLACVSYAVAAVFVRKQFSGQKLVDDPVKGKRTLAPVELGLSQTLTAAVPITVLAFLLEGGPQGVPVLPASPTAWFAVLWLGVLGSATAYLLFFKIIATWGATRTTLVTYVMPIIGIILGVLVLQEQVDARVLVGTVLVIGGIALVNSKYGQRRLYGRAPSPAQEG